MFRVMLIGIVSERAVNRISQPPGELTQWVKCDIWQFLNDGYNLPKGVIPCLFDLFKSLTESLRNGPLIEDIDVGLLRLITLARNRLAQFSQGELFMSNKMRDDLFYTPLTVHARCFHLSGRKFSMLALKYL
jgi:hypothetical protein